MPLGKGAPLRGTNPYPMKSKLTPLFGLIVLGTVLVSAAPAASPTMIGANIAGGDFGSALPGVIGTNYWYPRQPDIDMAKAIGIELVRVPFKWERIQHETAGVLDATLWEPDMAALDASITQMEARGMRIVLDLHNYGRRYLTVGGASVLCTIGSPQLPVSEFARVWRMLADRYKDRPSIWGYDLMNEPLGIPTEQLVTYYQAAVMAIREVDMNTAIILEGGPGFNHASSWSTTGAPLIAVNDPANNLIFSAHCYTDQDQSGTWSHGVTVAGELVGSGKPYRTLEAAYNVGVDRVRPFVDWCVANNVRGLLGEYASPYKTDEANWNIVTRRMLDCLVEHGAGRISATQWAHGGIALTSETRMFPRADNSMPSFQQTILPSYVSGVGTNFWQTFFWYNDAIVTTADYAFAYAFPTANVTIDAADTSSPQSGTRAIKVTYNLPAGVSGGGGLHTRGPLTEGAVGGVDLQRSVQAGHVLSFYAKGTPGATVSVTLGKTSNAAGIDTGSDTGAGNWINLTSIAPLTSSYQLYEIPLSSILNGQVTGNERVQRFRFMVGPADGETREVFFDRITIGIASTNTRPAVSIHAATGDVSFPTGQSLTLVAEANDADSGDSIDYVEFYANGAKIGIDDTAPYEWSAALPTPGTHRVKAIAFDSHGVAGSSAPLTLIATGLAPIPTGLAASPGNAQVQLSWTAALDAVSYRIKRATTTGGPYVIVGTSTATGFVDVGLTNDVTFYYVVSAVRTDGSESANSAQVSARPRVVTNPPVSLILDNTNSAVTRLPTTADWVTSTSSTGIYGSNYYHDSNTGAIGGKSVVYTPNLPAAGSYSVYLRWPALSNRASNTPVEIHHAGGTSFYTANQRINGGTWMLLGTFPFNTGTGGRVVIRNDGANGYVIADAVQFTTVSDTVAPSLTLPADLTLRATGADGAVATFTATALDAVSGPLPVSFRPASHSLFPIGTTTVTASATDAVGNVSTGTFTVTVTTDPPAIAASPASQTATVGEAVTFSVLATGAPAPSYQWLKNGAPLAGATTDTLVLSAVTTADAGDYSVRVANVAGETFSNAATLVVDRALATVTLGELVRRYSGEPESVSVTTAPADLAVTLSYNGNLAAPTYPGTYTVDAIVNDPDYIGSASGSLVIEITGLVRHAPSLGGIVEGSLQVLSGQSFALNSRAAVSGDILVPGTPAIQLNGAPLYGGTIDGSGSPGSSAYAITLNSGAVLRHVVRRTNPTAMPVVNPPPAPAGTRDVALNAGDAPVADFGSLRTLTLNRGVGPLAVPSGTYGRFTANHGSGFVLGVADVAEPAVYHFQNLVLNSGSELKIVGPVVVVLAEGLTLNGTVGEPAHPEWLELQIASGGLTLNRDAAVHGVVVAPQGAVTINHGAALHGRVSSDRLVVNSGGLLTEAP